MNRTKKEKGNSQEANRTLEKESLIYRANARNVTNHVPPTKNTLFLSAIRKCYRAHKRGINFPVHLSSADCCFPTRKRGRNSPDFFSSRHCEWRIAITSRSSPGFFRFLFIPFIVSRIFLLFFSSFPSPFLFSSIQDRSQTRDIRIDNARQCGNQQRSPFRSFDWNGWLAKISGIVEAGTHCEWHSAGPRGDGLFSWPGRREKWSGETNSRVTLFASSSPSLKLGWWQCAKLETSHRCEIRRAW